MGLRFTKRMRTRSPSFATIGSVPGKIREGVTSYEDPGWYKHPEGTVALVAAAGDLRRDNIEVPQGQATPAQPAHHDHHG